MLRWLFIKIPLSTILHSRKLVPILSRNYPSIEKKYLKNNLEIYFCCFFTNRVFSYSILNKMWCCLLSLSLLKVTYFEGEEMSKHGPPLVQSHYYATGIRSTWFKKENVKTLLALTFLTPRVIDTWQKQQNRAKKYCRWEIGNKKMTSTTSFESLSN